MKLKQTRKNRVNVKTTHYDREFKQRVIVYAEKTSNREAEKRYGISESNVRRWRKLKEEIFAPPVRKGRNKRKHAMKRNKMGLGFSFDRVLEKVPASTSSLGTSFCFALQQ